MNPDDLITILSTIAAELAYTPMEPDDAERQLRADPAAGRALLERVRALSRSASSAQDRALRLSTTNEQLRAENERLCRSVAILAVEAHESAKRRRDIDAEPPCHVWKENP